MAVNQSVTTNDLYGTTSKLGYLGKIWLASLQGFHGDTMENRTVLVLLGGGGDLSYLRAAGFLDCNIYGVERNARDCAKAIRKHKAQGINVLQMELYDAIDWLVECGIKIDIVSLDFCAFVHWDMLKLIQYLLNSGILSRHGRLAVTYMHARDNWFMRLTESLRPGAARKARAARSGDNPYRKLCRWLAFSKSARRKVLVQCLNQIGKGRIGFELLGEDSYTNRWFNKDGVECYSPMSWIVVKAIRGFAVPTYRTTDWESFA